MLGASSAARCRNGFRRRLPLALCIALQLSSAPALAAEEQLTTLRVVGQPLVKTEQILTPRISEVQATIKNHGSAEARGIRVEAILPDGQREELHGPDRLGKNKSATYSRSMYELITKPGKVTIKVECENCR